MTRDILTRPPPPGGERIAYGDHPSQFGELRVPSGPGPHPVVIYVHGGCWLAQWDLGHAAHACAGLTGAGLATWNIEYRRVGASGDSWPATFLDVSSGADHLRVVAGAYELDPARVVVAGHSAGGHLAMWLAARHRIPRGHPLHTPDPLRPRGAVALAGVLDLIRAHELRVCGTAVEQLLGGTPAAQAERYQAASPYELLPLGIRQILIHGRQDDVVPLEISERYRARAHDLADRVDLVLVDAADHFDLGDPRAPAFAAVVRAITTLLFDDPAAVRS